ncbi:MAG: histidine kinase dimerization/phospho-acceptor domain-containing protein, partial [Clostridiales bacterium]
YPITFLVMLISAFLTGTLAVKVKQNARQAGQTAYKTKVLLETNQLLQKTSNKQEIISITASQLAKLLDKDIVFYGTENNALAKPYFFLRHAQSPPTDDFSPTEQAVATWVFQNNSQAGATTKIWSHAKYLYLAIQANDIVYGVAGINLEHEPLDTFEKSIIRSILGECALALENHRTAKEREETAILARNEQLKADLLRSISHDLRTPLTSISGNAAILLTKAETIDAAKRQKLYADIYDDSLWLIDLVENLLSITRMADDAVKLHLTAELIDEVIAEALNHVNRRSTEHHISVRQEENVLIATMDVRLIVQVIIN